MSIPQPPIIYTGLNVAVPDWKSFNKDFNARMDMIRREKQQQRQFETQRQDQLNREFLKTVSVDQMNFTHAQFKQAAANVYQTADDAVSAIVQDKQGKMTFQDTMKAQAVMQRGEQELAKYKVWEQNWMKDMQAVQNPQVSGKFSEESKKAVMNYDGKTPYGQTKLQFREWDSFETEDKLKEVINNSNEMSVFSTMNGQGDVQSQEAFRVKFWENELMPDGRTRRLILDDNGEAIPDWGAQIKYVKGLLSSQAFSQGRMGIVRDFQKLSSDQQQTWKDIAANRGLREEDTDVLFFIEDYNPFEPKIKTKELAPKAGTGKAKVTTIDVTTGTGDFRDKPVKLTGTVEGAVTTEGKDVTVDKGLNDIVFTQIKYIENPKTGKKEWMAIGQYEEKTGKGFSVSTDAEGNMTLTQGGTTKTVKFLVPYNNVKEPLERNYAFKGMKGFKPSTEEEATITYTVKGKVYNIPISEEKGFLKSFPKAKKQ